MFPLRGNSKLCDFLSSSSRQLPNTCCLPLSSLKFLFLIHYSTQPPRSHPKDSQEILLMAPAAMSLFRYDYQTLPTVSRQWSLLFLLECCCERRAVQVKLLPWLGCFRERFASWTFSDGRHHARLWQWWKCASAFLVNGRLWLMRKMWLFSVKFIGWPCTAYMATTNWPIILSLYNYLSSFDMINLWQLPHIS